MSHEPTKHYTAGEALGFGDLVKVSDATTNPPTVKKTTAATDEFEGVVQDGVDNGDPVAVQLAGVAKVNAGAASIKRGDKVMPDGTTSGAVQEDDGSTSNRVLLGKCTYPEDGSASGDIIDVLLYNPPEKP